MSTSGTYGREVIEVDDLMAQAMQLSSLPASRLTPENVVIIKRLLKFVLIEVANLGNSMWTISRRLFGVYPGRVEVPLPVGTLDVLNYNERLLTRTLPSSVTSSAGGTTAYLSDSNVETIFTPGVDTTITFDLGGGPPPINVVGLLPGITETWSFVLESSIDGVTWVPIFTVTDQDVEDGSWLWYQLEPSNLTQFFRCRGTDSSTLTLREFYLCSTYYDIPMARLNRDDYYSLPFKQFPSQQTLQFWLDRQRDFPRMVLWPSPQTTFTCLAIALQMQVQDVGTQINSIDVPERALPAVLWSLARDINLSIPGADRTKYPELKERSKESMVLARGEERDKSPIFIGPNITPYTR